VVLAPSRRARAVALTGWALCRQGGWDEGEQQSRRASLGCLLGSRSLQTALIAWKRTAQRLSAINIYEWGFTSFLWVCGLTLMCFLDRRRALRYMPFGPSRVEMCAADPPPWLVPTPLNIDGIHGPESDRLTTRRNTPVSWTAAAAAAATTTVRQKGRTDMWRSAVGFRALSSVAATTIPSRELPSCWIFSDVDRTIRLGPPRKTCDDTDAQTGALWCCLPLYYFCAAPHSRPEDDWHQTWTSTRLITYQLPLLATFIGVKGLR
jgi:hypothetical protein